MIVDVVFPLRLKPLTYRVSHTAPEVLEGRIVRAPLGRRSALGVVVGIRRETGEMKTLKEIESFHHLFADAAQLSLLRWLSEYYLAPMGVALKSMFFQEVAACEIGSGPDIGDAGRTERPYLSDTASHSEGSPAHSVIANLGRGRYGAYLYHAGSRVDERQFLLSLIGLSRPDLKGALILVSEFGQIDPLAPVLREVVGERLAVLHSRLPKSRRKETISRLLEGESDVVMGTRSAVMAPLRRPSLIAVLDEHSPAYKAEEGLRYHGRDVAVMRGFLENSSVVLSSFCPSLESAYNARTGKYTLLNQAALAVPRPRQVVIGLKKTPGKGLTVSPRVLSNVREVVGRNRAFLFLVHRKGYSYIRCGECRDVIVCPTCEVPVVYHQATGSVRCRRCGHERKAPGGCPICGGAMLEPLGAGTERVSEEVRKLLGGDVHLVEKRPRTKQPDGAPRDSSLGGLVVGTPYAIRGQRRQLFGGAVIASLDQLLAQPNFRSHERALQEVFEVAQMVDPDGRVLLQTWAPRSRIVRQIASYDYLGFYEQEISQRRELGYPPFTRLVLITVTLRDESEKILPEALATARKFAPGGVEILGPAPVTSRRRGTGTSSHVLLKSRDRKSLHAVAQDLYSRLARIKGAVIVVDVDPLEV